MDASAAATTILDTSPRIFAGLATHTAGLLLGTLATRRLVQGEVLLDPAYGNEKVFLLATGRLQVCIDPVAGPCLAEILPGECAGEISILDTHPPTAYVVAGEECEVLEIHRDRLVRIMEDHPRVAVNILQILGERIRQNTVSLRRSLEELRRFRKKSETDHLTALYNRGWMEDVFPRQVELSDRTGQPLSAGLVDIDHFKQVNDEFGHAVGDSALVHVATCIARGLRGTDLCARYGGEEFAFLLPGTDFNEAVLIADRIRCSVANNPLGIEGGKSVALTVSIGLAERWDGELLPPLLARADTALYQAKAAGRNRVHPL